MSTGPANNNALDDKVYVCPTCGSAAITTSSFAGSGSECGKCGWKGRLEELAAVPFSHDFMSPEAMLHALSMDIRSVIAGGFGVELGRILLKWGFMPALTVGSEKDKLRTMKLLSRYIGAAAGAIATALISERMKMEVEDQNG